MNLLSAASGADSIDLSGFEPLSNGVSRLANGSDTLSAQTFLNGHANFEKNVGDIMTGDDLGFLDLYFPPEAGMSSTLSNTDFGPGMDYQS
jgi:X-X-X-Leu-X-X-Gly heptad repeat protein